MRTWAELDVVVGKEIVQLDPENGPRYIATTGGMSVITPGTNHRRRAGLARSRAARDSAWVRLDVECGRLVLLPPRARRLLPPTRLHYRHRRPRRAASWFVRFHCFGGHWIAAGHAPSRRHPDYSLGAAFFVSMIVFPERKRRHCRSILDELVRPRCRSVRR